MADSDITCADLEAAPGLGHILWKFSYNDPHTPGGLPYLQASTIELWVSVGTNDRSIATKVSEGLATSLVQFAIAQGLPYFGWVRAKTKLGYYGDFFPLADDEGVPGRQLSVDSVIIDDGDEVTFTVNGAGVTWPGGLILFYGPAGAVEPILDGHEGITELTCTYSDAGSYTAVLIGVGDNGKQVLDQLSIFVIGASVLDTIFDGTRIGESVELSSDHLTATYNGVFGIETQAYATKPITEGKRYFEISFTGTGTPGGVGIGGLFGGGLGSGNDTFGYYANGSVLSDSNTTIATYSSYTLTAVIGVMVDADDGFVYFSKNGVWQNSADPGVGTGGIAISDVDGGGWFPAVSVGGSVTNSTVANFGASAFANSPPIGSLAWND